MDQQLKNELKRWRLAAGKNGKPMGYKAWGDGLEIMYTSLFRFAKGQGTLGVDILRRLAQIASTNNDNAMIQALAVYALDIELSASIVEPVDN